MSFDIVSQYTVPYMSIQNDVIKKAIRITENSVCAMIKKIKLSIKFWAKAAQTDVYLHNCTATDLLINDKQVTSKKAFIEVKLFIDHVRVWEYKCYFYVNSKSLSKNRQNKFMNWEQVRVFMSYSEKTTKQYLLWASDLKWIIKSHAVKFTENKKEGSVNVMLHRQMLNVLSEWKPVEQPHKTETVTASLKQFLKSDMQTHRFKPVSSHSVITSLKKEITGNLLLKLTAVNFDHNASKLFSYVEIFVNKASHSDVSASIEKVVKGTRRWILTEYCI